MSFAIKLRKLRIEKGISQAELAEKIGYSKRTVISYESGNSLPRNRTVYEILAQTLGTDVRYLEDDSIDAFVDEAKEKYGMRGAEQAEQLMKEVSGLFAGGEMAEEDKDAMMEAIQKAYWIAKRKNREKNEKASGAQTPEE